MESGTDTPVSTGPNAVIGRECYTVLNVAPDRLLLCFASKNPQHATIFGGTMCSPRFRRILIGCAHSGRRVCQRHGQADRRDNLMAIPPLRRMYVIS